MRLVSSVSLAVPACRRIAASAFVAVIVSAAPFPAPGQAAQAWSLQASGMATSQRWENKSINGAGFEGQLRYTGGLLSWGFGAQYSTHSSKTTTGTDKLTISGGFIEPRYAIDAGSETFAPYVAGRLAALRQNLTFARGKANSGGWAVGAGAGTLIRVSATINLDLGVALLSQSFSNVNFPNGQVLKFEPFMGYVAKGGLSVGFGG
jgi:hypothetical protein